MSVESGGRRARWRRRRRRKEEEELRKSTSSAALLFLFVCLTFGMAGKKETETPTHRIRNWKSNLGSCGACFMTFERSEIDGDTVKRGVVFSLPDPEFA